MKTANIVLMIFLLLSLIYIFKSSPIAKIEMTEIVTKRDSIVRDTLHDTVPKYINKHLIKYYTIILKDTINFYVPISTYEFRDSTYRLLVEGYNVTPLLIETYPVTHYIMKDKVVNTLIKPKRITSGKYWHGHFLRDKRSGYWILCWVWG